MSEIQEFLYRIQPTRIEMLRSGPTKEESAIVSSHLEYLKRLTDEGVVLLAGRTFQTDETTFGIVIFRARSEAEASRVMKDDPAVKGGVMKAELFPFRVALHGTTADNSGE